jgi:nucleoside-diphosphate-sugar epimerase
MASSPIKTVLVIGAGGNVGRSTIKALLEEKFQVTGLTREGSKALPAGVKHAKTDYSEASLLEAFKGQDAVISTISGGGLALQKSIVDAAIAAGVKAFFPSEYGVDTSIHSSPEVVPFLGAKVEALDYLKTQQDKISWTAIISGCLFDWGLNIPSFGGFNVPARTVTIYDGGDIPYEATNLDQVGKVIAASLKQPELIKNKYVYVNSFTVTQNEVLMALEKATGEKFTASNSTVEELRQDGFKAMEAGQLLGMLALVASAFYGKGGLANYSVTRGLWNDKLGVPQENLDEFLKQYLAEKQ